MEEAYLHFIWRHQSFEQEALLTLDGIELNVILTGSSNPNSGPDFLQSKVRMGALELVGHIEIHIKSSDWYRHGHHNDGAYNPVVLHVVYEADQKVFRQDGSAIPQLELKGRLDEMPLWKYYQWTQNKKWIPCAEDVQFWNQEKAGWWLSRMAAERVEAKWNVLRRQLSEGKNLEQISWELWARAFGGTVNCDAFQVLAERIGWKKILQVAQRSQIEVDALLFGASGLLPKVINCEYEQILILHWKKYKDMWLLEPMDIVHWRFSRMRPAGFPTIRIAQLSALISSKRPSSFTGLKLEESNVQVSAYWKEHYHFGKVAAQSFSARITKRLKNHLQINAQILVEVTSNHSKGVEQSEWLDELAAIDKEENKITRTFQELGFTATNALESQGMKHLKENYCDISACWSCSIGQFLLTSHFENEKANRTIPFANGTSRI